MTARARVERDGALGVLALTHPPLNLFDRAMIARSPRRWGGTQRLVERAGPARAREVVMTGELFDADTLERWNVVNRVLADEGFDGAARAFAHRLADGPTRAHAATKTIVRAALDGGADRLTAGLVGALVDTDDHRGAVAAFLERGPGHDAKRTVRRSG